MAIIYKITNNINKKIYIGETTRTLNIRWNEHKHQSFTPGHGYNYHIHCAIRKYGIKNFSIEEIERCADDERFKVESEYIKKYNSLEPNGYNFLPSGTGDTKVPIEVLLKEWNDGLTLTEISKKVNLKRGTISAHLKNSGITEEEIKRRQGEYTSSRCSRAVLQYDLNGNFIKRWKSTTECGKQPNYTQSGIAQAARGEVKSAYGFLWMYEDEEKSVKELVEKNRNKGHGGKPSKKTAQFDTEFNLIKIYPSAMDAAKAFGKKDKSNICHACRSGHKAYGYYWKYIEESEVMLNENEVPRKSS